MSTRKTWKIAGINFDHMHMGDLLRQVYEHPDAENNLQSLEAVFALIASTDEGRTVRVGEARRLGSNCQIHS